VVDIDSVSLPTVIKPKVVKEARKLCNRDPTASAKLPVPD